MSTFNKENIDIIINSIKKIRKIYIMDLIDTKIDYFASLTFNNFNSEVYKRYISVMESLIESLSYCIYIYKYMKKNLRYNLSDEHYRISGALLYMLVFSFFKKIGEIYDKENAILKCNLIGASINLPNYDPSDISKHKCEIEQRFLDFKNILSSENKTRIKSIKK